MKILQTYHSFTFIIIFLLHNNIYCIHALLFNDSNIVTNGVERAVATWYGPPEGPGSGGACGFGNDVSLPPYSGMISAGNDYLFQGGRGCGSCYWVKCINNPYCSGYALDVTITDQCPGACNNERVHFDLSGLAFGYLAKQGQGDALRKLGRIDVEFGRVPCKYNWKITFKVDGGSNPNYFACAIEDIPQDGTILKAELKPSNSGNWITMQQVFGATWKANIYPGQTNPPFSIRITTKESHEVFTSYNVIPVGWQPNKSYS